MPKHGNDPPVLVYSRAFARDDHRSACAFLETRHAAVHEILAHRPRNGSHLLHCGFLEVGDGPGLPWVHVDRNLHPVFVHGQLRAARQEMHGINGAHLEQIRTNASRVHKNRLIAIIFWIYI